MLAPGVRHIQKNEIPVLASFLAGIFFNNEVYAGIFPDPVTRKGRLAWLFNKNLLLQHAEKNTWVMISKPAKKITDAKDIIATLTFLPSAEKKSTIADYIKKGLLAMPFKFGIKAFKSLLKANSINEQGIHQIAADKPFWYLSMVAVAPEHRKKGIASRLINNIIQDKANPQTFHNGYNSVLLTTQSESNVRLYTTLGFITTNVNIQSNYTIWTMKKVITC